MSSPVKTTDIVYVTEHQFCFIFLFMCSHYREATVVKKEKKKSAQDSCLLKETHDLVSTLVLPVIAMYIWQIKAPLGHSFLIQE